MAARFGNFTFDARTMVSLLIVVALLGIGYSFGQGAGVKSAQKEFIEQGGLQQSLAGVVKSASKEGFVLKIEDVSAGAGAIAASSGTQNTGDEWSIKYGKGGASTALGVMIGQGNQKLKKGDKVQVSGVVIGKNTLVAQSVTKVTPPSPSPTPSPAAQSSESPKPLISPAS